MNVRPVSDHWDSGSPYERYIGRWSRRVAPGFLSWLEPPAGRAWVDVGCGTGALSSTILDRCAPQRLTGVEPSDGFRQMAAQLLGERMDIRPGDAAHLPLEDASCDLAVSGLVLNFVPDLPAALAEMCRVVVPGGTIAAYVWDYADGMEVIRHVWDAAVRLDPGAAGLHEGVRFPLCHPAALQAAFEDASLGEVAVAPLVLTAAFEDFDDYWQPFLGGQGPAPAYVASLSDERRTQLRDTLRSTLAPDGRGFTLPARAWAVRGRRPGGA
jgi:SAM-dependent methyltransferase